MLPIFTYCKRVRIINFCVLCYNENMSKKKQQKKTPEQLKAEQTAVFVKETVVKTLNEDSKSVVVKHLFEDRFRVNVWKDGRINKSFFIVAEQDKIIKSDPEIK